MEVNRQNKWVTPILLIALIVGMAFLLLEFRHLNREGSRCRSSPFVWGAQKVSQKEGMAYVECSCSVSGDDRYIPFKFSNKGLNLDPYMQQRDFSFLNVSALPKIKRNI